VGVPRWVRRAVRTADAPRLWHTGVVALLGVVLAAGAALALGLRDVALAAGLVAALSGAAGSLVPASLARQVAVPAWVAVALSPPLALLGQGRPLVAGLVALVVFALGALVQVDVPAGRLTGALGSTAYVLAVGMGAVRDVVVAHALLAGAVGLVVGAALTAGLQVLMRRRAAASAAPPRLPGRWLGRTVRAVGRALKEWRTNPYVRLAVRRGVVLAPLVGVLEAWRDPVALYALVVAFSVTQPVAGDTTTRALARTLGAVAAIVVTYALAAVLPPAAVGVVAVLAMVVGLAYLLRSPFVVTLGTTVLTVAGGVVVGTSAPAVQRLLSTLLGAAVALLATVLVPAPRRPASEPRTEQGTGDPAQA